MFIPLSEGTFSVNDSKQFIPFNPAADQQSDRPGSLIVDIVPFLVNTGSDLVVIDPGLGLQTADGDFTIHQNLASKGFRAEDITMVLLSHLHKDHAGGVCYGNEPAYDLMFPNAAYYCQTQELDYAFTRKDTPSYVAGKLDFLSRSPNLVLLDGDGRINDRIAYEISGGHTPYHQVFTIETPHGTCFYGGDVLPQPKQLQMKFIAKYDFDGKLAAARRIEYGNRAAESQYTCLFFHSASMPMATVEKNGTDKFMLHKA